MGWSSVPYLTPALDISQTPSILGSEESLVVIATVMRELSKDPGMRRYVWGAFVGGYPGLKRPLVPQGWDEEGVALPSTHVQGYKHTVTCIHLTSIVVSII